MSISPILLALSGSFLGLGTPPVTHSADGAAFVDASPVSDTLLGQSHGTGPGITLRSLRTLATQRSRDDAEFIGSIGQTQMDVWWQTDGAALIATSVRANLPLR